MENPISICREHLNLIQEVLSDFLNKIGEKNLPRAARQDIKHLENNYKNFLNYLETSPIDIEAAISSAEGVAIHARSLGMKIKNSEEYSNEAKAAAAFLEDVAIGFKLRLESGEEFSSPYLLSIGKIFETDRDLIKNGEKTAIENETKIRSELEALERDLTKGKEEIENLRRKSSEYSKSASDELSSLSVEIKKINSEISQLQEKMIGEIAKAEGISKEAQERSEEVNEQIDGLLGLTASRVLLVDYANTAQTEKRAADILRNSSLFCMTLTGLVLLVAIFASIGNEFDWKQAIFKLITAAALSVPAAYLARESARHRTQEHLNRRISLDLRAISPYIATLPSEEQNRIKSEVASRIFGIQEGAHNQADNYPINIQELTKMLIEKIPTPK